MPGDIAIVGFVLTADEWDALDSRAQAELLAAAFEREAAARADPELAALSGNGQSGPNARGTS